MTRDNYPLPGKKKDRKKPAYKMESDGIIEHYSYVTNRKGGGHSSKPPTQTLRISVEKTRDPEFFGADFFNRCVGASGVSNSTVG